MTQFTVGFLQDLTRCSVFVLLRGLGQRITIVVLQQVILHLILFPKFFPPVLFQKVPALFFFLINRITPTKKFRTFFETLKLLI